MKLANEATAQPASDGAARRATLEDAGAIQRLLRESVFTHVHVDWQLPGDWLGTPGFAVYEQPEARGRGADRLFPRRNSAITACLAIGADPPPAAWVRVAAVDRADGLDQLASLLALLERTFTDGVDELSWFVTEEWPDGWFEPLGFAPVNEVITYRKGNLDLPSLPVISDLLIRPVRLDDLPALEAIEVLAFEPRWRHSTKGLRLALAQTMSFDVAERDGKLVGFQFSTRGTYGAHLARMTIHPDYQGQGIGKLLLAEAINSYRRAGLSFVTLNTPSDNEVSQRLYRGFGFERTGPSFAVLARPWPAAAAY